MGKDMAQDGARTLVARRVDGGEEFGAWVERVGGQSRIVVGTHGQDTRAAFGSDWRMSCVAFDGQVEGAVIRSLVGDASEQTIERACASYFASDRQLSDLLDQLDACGVPYVYACADEGGVAWRPEPGECEPVAIASS